MDILLGLAVSTHLGLTGDYNEIHPHIELTSRQFVAGAYYNSIETGSIYLGIENKVNDKIILETGIVTGYDNLATVIPYAKINYSLQDNAELFMSPTFEKNNNDYNLGLVLGILYYFK